MVKAMGHHTSQVRCLPCSQCLKALYQAGLHTVSGHYLAAPEHQFGAKSPPPALPVSPASSSLQTCLLQFID